MPKVVNNDVQDLNQTVIDEQQLQQWAKEFMDEINDEIRPKETRKGMRLILNWIRDVIAFAFALGVLLLVWRLILR